MKKVFLKSMLLLCALIVGSNSLWADSYTITFKTGDGDGTSISNSTALSTIVSDGSSYLTGKASSPSNVYHSGDYGLKLGKSSGSGSITMGLSTSGQVKATTIVVRAKLYNSSNAATVRANGKSAQSVGADFADYTFTINSNITTITLYSSKYIWVQSVTVNYEILTTVTSISSVGITNTDLASGTSAGSLSASVTAGGSAVGGASVSWTSSNTSVATINSSGVVTLVSAGSTTITASYAGNSEYKPSSNTYVLSVTDTRTTTVTSVNSTGITNTNIKNGTSAGSLSASVTAGGSAVGGASVSWTSSNTSVATINSSGVVTLVSAGSTTITASYTGEATFASSYDTYDLVVSDTRATKAVEISLNNAFFGTSYSGALSADQKTALRNAGGYVQGTKEGVSVKYDIATSSNFYVSNDQIRTYENTKLIISAPDGFVLTDVAFVEPGSSKAWGDTNIPVSSGTYTSASKSWSGNTQTLTFSFAATDRMVGVNVTVAHSHSVTPTPDKYYATFYAPYNVKLPTKDNDGEDITVEAFIGVLDGSSLKLYPFDGTVVPLETPIIIKSSSSAVFNLTSTSADASELEDNVDGVIISDNDLIGTDIDISGSALSAIQYPYILGYSAANSQPTGFYIMPSSGTILANKAYLEINEGPSSAPSIRIVEVENNTTSIDKTETIEESIKYIRNGILYIKRDGKIYDLTGRIVK